MSLLSEAKDDYGKFPSALKRAPDPSNMLARSRYSLGAQEVEGSGMGEAGQDSAGFSGVGQQRIARRLPRVQLNLSYSGGACLKR